MNIFKNAASFFKKARLAGMNLPNCLSWASLELMRVSGLVTGTLALRVKARLLGVNLGRNVLAHGPVGLLRWPGGAIRIGDNVRIISSWRRATACSLAFPARLRVFGQGASIEIGPGCELSGTSITARSCAIRLGQKVLVAPNCIVVDSDFHAPEPVETRSTNPGLERDSGVTIDDHVWIGMNSIVLKGSHIGRGAVIGAGSVVRGYIPPYCVAAGAPARVVRWLNQGSEAGNERK